MLLQQQQQQQAVGLPERVLISAGRSEDAVDRLQPIIAGELPQREVAAIAASNWAVACFNTGVFGGVGSV